MSDLGPPVELDERDAEAVAALRERCAEDLAAAADFPEVTGDIRLLRFLRGQKYDLNLAAKMLSKMLQWRKEAGIDAIRSSIVEQDLQPAQFPFAKRVMPALAVNVNHRPDKEARPVAVERTGMMDPRTLIQNVTLEQYLSFHLHYMEYKSLQLERLSRAKGTLVRSMTIRDLSGLGLQHAWKPGIEFMQEIIKVTQDNYPDTMEKCFIVNAPWAFNAIWKFVKPLLSQQTCEKIIVLGGDYRPTLLEFFDDDALPAFLGGSCSCDVRDCVPLPSPDAFEDDDHEDEEGEDDDPNRPQERRRRSSSAAVKLDSALLLRSLTRSYSRMSRELGQAVYGAHTGDEDPTMVAGSKWVSDAERDECIHCQRKWTAYYRRHHCRMCGELVCGPCSPHRVEMRTATTSQRTRFARVCTYCFTSMQNVKVSADAPGAAAASAGGGEAEHVVLWAGLKEELLLTDLSLSEQPVGLKLRGKGTAGVRGATFELDPPFERGTRWVTAADDADAAETEQRKARIRIKQRKVRDSEPAALPPELRLKLGVALAALVGARLLLALTRWAESPLAVALTWAAYSALLLLPGLQLRDEVRDARLPTELVGLVVGVSPVD